MTDAIDRAELYKPATIEHPLYYAVEFRPPLGNPDLYTFRCYLRTRPTAVYPRRGGKIRTWESLAAAKRAARRWMEERA